MEKESYLSAITYDVEERTNKFILRCMVITYIIYVAAWVLDVLNVFIVDRTIMNNGLVGMSVFMAAVFLVCKIMGYENVYTKYVVMFLSVCMYTLLNVNLTYHVILITVFPLMCCVQYNNKKMIIYTYILTLIGIIVTVVFGYKYGLCDGNMLLLTNGTTAQQAAKFANGEFSMNENYALLILFFAFPRCLVTTAFIPLLKRMRQDIEQRVQQELILNRRAETDDMTSLYNKNKYLDLLKNYYPNVDRVGVVFWDVNNLKKVNDEYGHEIGDQLIVCVAESIAKFRSESNKIFRIGGDEFVMICENAEPGDMDNIIAKWKKSFANKTLENGVLVRSAVGCAEGIGADIEKIVKQADEMMYQNKKNMKQ